MPSSRLVGSGWVAGPTDLVVTATRRCVTSYEAPALGTVAVRRGQDLLMSRNVRLVEEPEVSTVEVVEDLDLCLASGQGKGTKPSRSA